MEDIFHKHQSVNLTKYTANTYSLSELMIYCFGTQVNNQHSNSHAAQLLTLTNVQAVLFGIGTETKCHRWACPPTFR